MTDTEQPIDPETVRRLKDDLISTQAELAALKYGATLPNQADEATCPRCSRNIKIWSDDILLRLGEWQALLNVSCRLTKMSQGDLMVFVVREKEEIEARESAA